MNRKFLPASLWDNPGINAEQYAGTLDRLDPVLRAQLLEGDWDIEESGGVFDPSTWEYVDDFPDAQTVEMSVRYWDMAGTEPSERNPDPDYTVGVKVELSGGLAWLTDIVRFRAGPARVLNQVQRVAAADGEGVHIVIEEEGGSSGKAASFHYAQNLPGYYVDFDHPTGPKFQRATRTASALRNKTLLVHNQNRWVSDMRSEFALYTGETKKGFHDDQVDAVSGALAWLFGDGRIYTAVV